MNTNSRGIIYLLVGLFLLLIAVGAAYLVFSGSDISFFNPPAQPTVVPTIKTTVIIAAQDLFLGHVITASDLKEMTVPVEVVPRNAILNQEDVIGKFLKVDLIQGQMVLEHQLADPTNTNKDLGYIIADDHVLMAFPASDLISRESVIKRGDIVDLFVSLPQTVKTFNEETQEEEEVTQLFTFSVLQRVEITAMVMDIIVDEQEQQTPTEEPPQEMTEQNYTIRAYLIALDPQDALMVKYLKDIGGMFDIVLRSPTSENQFGLTPVTEQYIIELFGLEIIP